MPNRLQNSTSLYLRQHAGNPVEWWPWGPEALAEARRRDQPVLLSIGYSACHWCHVMAHESFEDPLIAAKMNQGFVCIKVDREERPDLDALYLGAVQVMTGHAGWPLTVFLTAAGEPFYGGTYFPPTSRHGLPSFSDVLDGVTEAWMRRREDILKSAGELTAALVQLGDARKAGLPAVGSDTVAGDGGVVAGVRDVVAGDQDVLDGMRAILAQVDMRWGGFQGAPKFPHCTSWQFLLARFARNGPAACRDAVSLTLSHMAAGGIHDQLAGGFHRYSVDGTWTVPHFEKMLYDNAQLASLYLDHWRMTGELPGRLVCESTLDYLLREMRSPEGGFYATQDADSEGGEGAYFVWNPRQLEAVLDHAAAIAVAREAFGISDEGNFEHGASVLTARRTLSQVAAALGRPEGELGPEVERLRDALLAARNQRPAPATDPKIIVAWNGLAISALARAGAALGRTDYLAAAQEAGEFIWSRLGGEAALVHSWAEGAPGLPAFQDDFAALARGFLDLYEADFAEEWLTRAELLGDEMWRQFRSPNGGLALAGPKHEILVASSQDWLDASLPSGNAMAAGLLLRLAALRDRDDLRQRSASILSAGSPFLQRAPTAAGSLLSALDDYLGGSSEVAVVDNLDPEAARDRRPSPAAASLLAELRRHVLPGTVIAYAPSPDAARSSRLPLLHDRPLVDGVPTAYLCRQYACQTPVTSAEALRRQIKAL